MVVDYNESPQTHSNRHTCTAIQSDRQAKPFCQSENQTDRDSERQKDVNKDREEGREKDTKEQRIVDRQRGTHVLAVFPARLHKSEMRFQNDIIFSGYDLSDEECNCIPQRVSVGALILNNL